MTTSTRDRLREILLDNDCDEHPLSDADYDRVIDAILAVFAEGERDRDVLRTTATMFLARFDELMPHVNDYIATACIRVGRNDWGYGHWLGELTAFRAALAASVVTKEEE